MTKYPKIETLYKRDPDTFKVTNEIRLPEFSNIKNWLVQEKIDGTNIRVQYERSKILMFRGKTDKAQIPVFLLEKLKEMFPAEKVNKVFSRDNVPPERMIQQACLYGEGYGARIQKGGGNYREGVSFRLVDVWVDGWWLRWDSVEEVAIALSIDTAPVLAPHTLREAVYLIRPNEDRSEVKSVVAVEDGGNPETRMEGIVARAHPMVLFRKSNPVVWKLKVKDFAKEEG